VRATVTINVARTKEEAERQARGEDVLAEPTEAEEEAVAAGTESVFEEGAGPKEDDSEGDETNAASASESAGGDDKD